LSPSDWTIPARVMHARQRGAFQKTDVPAVRYAG
jgi:hypothetical protein